MPPLVTIAGLHIRFPEQTLPAVQDVGFSIMQGETFALVGESGSGKSLTALSLPNLLPSSAIVKGKITGHLSSAVDLLKTTPTSFIRGREIGVIFQKPMTSLNPVYTCGEQVMESLMLHKGLNRKEAARHAIQLFEKAELPDPSAMLHRYPHQISGGQRQ